MESEIFHAHVETWLAESPILAALTLSLLAGVVLTGIGTLSVLAFGELSEKRNAALLPETHFAIVLQWPPLVTQHGFIHE